MGYQGKQYSKNGRKGNSHVCACSRPISGTRIRRGLTTCGKCGTSEVKGSQLGGGWR